MKIVGIDPSLTGTGIYIIDDDNEPWHSCLENELTGPERLVYIRNVVMTAVYDADLVVIENYSYGSSTQAYQAGELGGLLRVMFYETGLTVLPVSPTQIKKFATGKSGAKKEIIIKEVYKRWGVEFDTNDEADAFVLAKIGQAYHPDLYVEGMTAFQKEVIDALRNPTTKKRKQKGR